MKLKLSSFILVLTTMFINSQTIIQGVVKNEENKNLSYCAIGIKDTDIGAITNENGIYKIIIPKEVQNKNVVFKADGYKEKNVEISELKVNPNIYLKFKN